MNWNRYSYERYGLRQLERTLEKAIKIDGQLKYTSTFKEILNVINETVNLDETDLQAIGVPFSCEHIWDNLPKNGYFKKDIHLISTLIFSCLGISDLASCISERTQDKKEKEEHHYPHIPLWFEQFYDFFRGSPRKNLVVKKFIDAGSGSGEKVFIANLMGMIGYGIEYNAGSYSVSKANPFITPEQRERLIHGDVFEHDFSPYDIIYSYVPIADHKFFKDFTRHIMDTMRIGAYKIETAYGIYGQFKDIEIVGRFGYFLKKIGKKKFEWVDKVE